MLPTKANNGQKFVELYGEVTGRDVILVDDVIDSGNTVVRSAAELSRRGAKNVYVFATHGVFSEGAFDRCSEGEC